MPAVGATLLERHTFRAGGVDGHVNNEREGLAAKFSADLKDAVAYARSNVGNPSQSSALYGMAGTPEGNQMVDDLLRGVFDHMYDI